MRILFVNDYGAMYGGAERTIIGLRDEMRRRGHRAALFTSSVRPAGAASFADFECRGTAGSLRTLLQSANPWARLRLGHVLRQFRPDVVHVGLFLTQLSPLILPLLRTVPSIYHVMWSRFACPIGTKQLPDGSACGEPWGRACLVHGCLPVHDWLPLMGQLRLLEHWWNAFEEVLVESETMRSMALTAGLGPVQVIGNAVAAADPRPFPGGQPVVVAGGRLVPTKGFAELVEAFAIVVRSLPKARLVIIGHGPEASRLVRLASDLGIAAAVTFAGFVEGPALDAIFRTAWITVVPSLAPESFCLVAAESMIRGVPVVATDAGALAETVRDGEGGLVVSAGDLAALAGAIRSLLEPSRANALGGSARESAVRRFGFDDYSNRIEEVYERLATRGPSRFRQGGQL